MDTSQPEGAPALDELQRAGAVHLLRAGLDAIEAIEGEGGEVVEIIDHFVGVHPGGALLKVFVKAPSLEDAEGAVESVVGEILESTQALAAWTIDKCEVELHLGSAAESLAAADGPDAPPAALSSRAAAYRKAQSAEENSPGVSDEERQEMRSKLAALAPLLADVGPSAFGHLTAEDLEDGEEVDEEFNVSAEDAALAPAQCTPPSTSSSTRSSKTSTPSATTPTPHSARAASCNSKAYPDSSRTCTRRCSPASSWSQPSPSHNG
ncbi:hypothetical protein [Streptacidiphilus sp. BW17]|uniref:hypothetical protein n=1 Tax=Streptacidiphilus sp. BW17 TaxID=3156274 RepID=UPI003512F0B7